MKYFYIKNGKLEELSSLVFFYEWTLDGGSTAFGFHGTEEEWQVKLGEMQILQKHTVSLHLKRFIPPERVEE